MAKRKSKSISQALGISNITTFNRVIAGIFLLQGVAIILQSQKVTVAVVDGFMRTADTAGEPIDPGNVLFELVVPTILAYILLASAVSYMINSTSGMGWYIKSIKHRMNYMRWLQFSVSGSLLIALVALLSGLNGILTLVVVGAAMISVSVYGVIMERANQRKRTRIDWRPYRLSLITSIGLIFTLMITSSSADSFASRDASIWMYLVLLFAHISYAATMYTHYKKIGSFKNYVNAEEGFMLIDLLSKSVITWLIYFAVSS